MVDELRHLAGRIVRAVSIARLRLVDDSGAQQRAQARINAGAPDGVEEVIDRVPRLGDYGFHSCPPEGSEAVLLHLGGRRTAAVIIATGYLAGRPKGLAPGEVMLFNALAAQYIVASADGKFRSQAPDWLHSGDHHVSGTAYAAHVIPADGWTGTFATGDARTVTVTRGIVTNVA